MKKWLSFCLLTLVVSGCQKEAEQPVKKTPVKEEVAAPVEQEEIVDGWRVIFKDEFNSNKVDTKKWDLVDRGENYNNELQYYSPKNVVQSNGQLSMVAKREEYKKHHFTSGHITTQNTFAFKYGKLEVRMKHPGGVGMFPAAWMLPASGKSGLPEVDMFEAVGHDPTTIHMVSHWENKSGNLQSAHDQWKIENLDEFHLYELEWNENEMIWSIDGQQVFTVTENIPDEKMYLLFNLAVGGNWPGAPNDQTVFPSSLVLDYVKVYEKVNQ